MKKKVRNALAISGLVITMGTSGLIFDANASMGPDSNSNRPRHEKTFKKRVGQTQKNSWRKHSSFGVISSISANSLTMTRGNKTFNVSISDATRLLSLHWKNISFSDIKTGDKIKVAGTFSDNTITAKTIRDISFQAK